MIIDAFTFHDELSLLDIRLNELNSTCDFFILVENAYTQRGDPKPLFYHQNKARFEKSNDRIIHVKLNECKSTAPGDWSNEHFQRRSIVKGLVQMQEMGIDISKNDTVLISDVDEVPKSSVINKLASTDFDVLSLNHYFNSYYLNWFSEYRSWGWYGTILTRARHLQTLDIQQLRNVKDGLPHTGNSGEGYHFSNLLVNGFESMFKKWLSTIEPINKPFLKDKELLKAEFEKCVYQDRCFFFSDRWTDRSIKLKTLDFELLPEYVKVNFMKFEHLIPEQKYER